MVAVQASLLAAGSLAPHLVRQLSRRPALAQRYLAVEGQRALACNESVLPPLVRRLVDSDAVTSLDTPEAALQLARSRQAIPAPAPVFGTILARRLLAAARGERRRSTHRRRRSRDAEHEQPRRPRRARRRRRRRRRTDRERILEPGRRRRRDRTAVRAHAAAGARSTGRRSARCRCPDPHDARAAPDRTPCDVVERHADARGDPRDRANGYRLSGVGRSSRSVPLRLVHRHRQRPTRARATRRS